ncbi:MAG: hypothetical protein K2X49_26390 [Acetobacteraceae bacterium]|nr:hypothetical protein [Acetobacteraceae bacterium]
MAKVARRVPGALTALGGMVALGVRDYANTDLHRIMRDDLRSSSFLRI